MVGEIMEVRAGLLETLLLARLTPVIAPMAPSSAADGGPPLNVNADDAAAAIAGALHAAELLLVSDVPGVAVDGVLQRTLEAGGGEAPNDVGAAAGGQGAQPPAPGSGAPAGA